MGQLFVKEESSDSPECSNWPGVDLAKSDLNCNNLPTSAFCGCQRALDQDSSHSKRMTNPSNSADQLKDDDRRWQKDIFQFFLSCDSHCYIVIVWTGEAHHRIEHPVKGPQGLLLTRAPTTWCLLEDM